MSEVLTDLSAPSLSRAVKWNLYDFFRGLGRARQTETVSAPGLLRWRTRITHPWFSGVLSTRPATSDDAQTVMDAVAQFKLSRVPAFTWWLAPEVDVTGWGPLLTAYGFRLDANSPGMAVDLEQLNESLPVTSSVEIISVSDDAGQRAWTETFIAGYGLPVGWTDDVLELVTDLGWEWPFRNCLALLAGRPVATATVFLGAGVAGIYNVATIPAARGQGIGAAVTLAPLQDARDRGYRVGVLQSSDMGFPVYQRLGFREVCRMEHFYRATGEA